MGVKFFGDAGANYGQELDRWISNSQRIAAEDLLATMDPRYELPRHKLARAEDEQRRRWELEWTP